MTLKQLKIPSAVVASFIIALTGGTFTWAATIDNKVNTLEVQQGHDTEFRKDTTKQLEILNRQQAANNEALNWVVLSLKNRGFRP
jgi:hypothetical protein